MAREPSAKRTVKTPRAADLVHVVETAYQLGGSDAAWLRRVMAALEPHLDFGDDQTGFLFDASDPRALRCWAIQSESRPDLVEVAKMMHALTPPEEVARLFRSGPALTSVCDALGLDSVQQHSHLGRLLGAEYVDQWGLRAADPTYCGLVISTHTRRPGVRPSRKAIWQWARVASHLSAALRLRRSLTGSDSTDPAELPTERLVDGCDAVLEPDGNVAHAVGRARSDSAREALRRAARRVDAARAALRRQTPDEAIEVWTGLIAGRWSLIDSFDADGRRFLVARRNDPKVVDPRALTLRERQVAIWAGLGRSTKEIAYDLGLSPATVQTHLWRGARKLGARSQAELVALMGRLAPASSDRPVPFES